MCSLQQRAPDDLHLSDEQIERCASVGHKLQQKYNPIIIVPTFCSERTMKNSEGVPRGRGLAAPRAMSCLSIYFVSANIVTIDAMFLKFKAFCFLKFFFCYFVQS